MIVTNLIASIDAEIANLQQARDLIAGFAGVSKKRGRKPGTTTKRVLSPEARQRIAAAQKRRWAAQKKAAKQTAKAAQ